MRETKQQPYYEDDLVTLHHGDCLDVLASMPDCSVDAVVTDPPYGLGFMGRDWDDLPPGVEFAAECLRVLKPGGHMLAFGGSRTWHRLACAIEDAGFEIRDSIAWLYGSGFPKSLNVATAIERLRSAKPIDHRTDLLPDEDAFCQWMRDHSGLTTTDARRLFGSDRFITGEVQIVNTATVDNPRMGRRAMVPTYAAWQKARPALAVDPPEWVESLVKSPPQPGADTPGEEWKPGKGQGTIGDNEWAGWGTALKPSHEPVVVARKPLEGTVAANVLQHGTGALNIDGCRVGETVETWPKSRSCPYGGPVTYGSKGAPTEATQAAPAGRWPTNVVLDDSQAAELNQQSGEVGGGTGRSTRGGGDGGDWNPTDRTEKAGQTVRGDGREVGFRDTGGASRFFPTFRYEAKAPTDQRPKVDGVAHPTVKPLDLMRWLVRLVTPPGGTVLEPFAGSGSTAEACVIEGFRCIAIEREATYLPLIVARLSKPIQPVMFGEPA